MTAHKENLTRSLSEIMADKAGLTKAMFVETIKKICMPQPTTKHPKPATDEEMVAFLMVANNLDLNPFTKEIYAIRNKFGGISFVIAVDGWLRMINRHDAFNGMSFTYEREGNKLISTTCKIFRKDRDNAIEVTEFFDECEVKPYETNKPGPWQQFPARMLRHRAMVQCARYAFSFVGAIDEEEARDRYMVVPEPVQAKILEEDVTELRAIGQTHPDLIAHCLNRCHVERIEDIPAPMLELCYNYLDGELEKRRLQLAQGNSCSTDLPSSDISAVTQN